MRVVKLLLKKPKKKAEDFLFGAPPLGPGGVLLKGHCYLIVFFNCGKNVLKAALKADAITKRVRGAGAGSWFHPLLVSREAIEKLENVSKHWKDRATPMAHDADHVASIRYITEHRAYVQPHAFLVDRAGIICWHGHINRPELPAECARLLREGAELGLSESLAAAKGSMNDGSAPSLAAQGDGGPSSTESMHTKKDQ